MVLHYCMHWGEMVFPKKKFGRRLLYRAVCRCGFSCEAYGRTLTDNQMQGHIKTMAWLEEHNQLKS